MTHTAKTYTLALTCTLACLAPATPAAATEHLVEMIEVFSDATGTFQFVNLRILSDFQNNQRHAFIESEATGNTIPLIDMPAFSGGQHVLIGTAAVQDALGFTNGVGATGVDILMPDNFFDTSADTLSYKLNPFDPGTGEGSFFFDSLEEGAHQFWGPSTGNTLPTDGMNSLVFGFHGLGLDPHDHIGLPAVNSPRNFSGETGTVVTEPPDPLTITVQGVPTNAGVVSYSSQDSSHGNVTIDDDGATISTSEGNAWKKAVLPEPVNITPETVLSFDFSSTQQAELQGIGIDSDDTVNNGNERFFSVFGTDGAFPSMNFDFHDYPRGGSLGDVVHYDIPIGTFFNGTADFITFFTDSDVSPNTGQSTFSNVTLSVPEPATAMCLLTLAAPLLTCRKRSA